MKTLLLIAITLFVVISFPMQTKKVLGKSVDGIGYVYSKAKPVFHSVAHKAVNAGKDIAKD